MQIYKKRKKKKIRDDSGSIAVRYRTPIIAVLVVIIIAGGIAAVHAVEHRRSASLQAMQGADSDETVIYYYDADGNVIGDSTGDAAGGLNGGNAGGAGADAGSQQGGIGATGTETGADGSALAPDSAEDAEYPDLSQSEITWNGVRYKRQSYIKPILCLGIDRTGDMQTEQEYGYAGQADGVFLIAQDTARNTVRILMIPRDTMTEVTEMNPETGAKEPYIDHLSLSYCFGDGREQSCANTLQSVEKLLMGFKLSDYMAVDMSVIESVNDAVGGVTVTVPTEGMEQRDPAFVYGETVTLHGAQAEKFIRYRDKDTDNSALMRMMQHRQYIEGFFNAVKAQSRRDSQTVVKLVDMVQSYMITNMPKDGYMKTALDVLQAGDISDDNFLILPGYGTATDTFDEYYASKEGTVDTILSMFYSP